MMNACRYFFTAGVDHHVSLKQAKMSRLSRCVWTNSPKRIHQASEEPTTKSKIFSTSMCSSRSKAPCLDITSWKLTDAPRLHRQQIMRYCGNTLNSKKVRLGSHLAGTKSQVKARGACLVIGLKRRDMVGRVTPIGTTNAAKTAPTPMGTESWAHHHSGLEPLGVIFFEH